MSTQKQSIKLLSICTWWQQVSVSILTWMISYLYAAGVNLLESIYKGMAVELAPPPLFNITATLNANTATIMPIMKMV